MPVFTNKTLVDNSVTPSVDHVFGPQSNQNSTAMFADRSPERVADWPKLSIRTGSPTKAAGKGTQNVVLTVPIPVEDQSGCCVDKNTPTVIAMEAKASVTTTSTADQRKTAVALFRSYVNSQDFEDLVVKLENYWS